MSEPNWTQRATLEYDPVAHRLIAHNGGWQCDSGPVTGYIFRFVRSDGTTTAVVPPFRETHDAARLRLTNGQVNVLNLGDLDRGKSFTVECYGVTFSGAWGTEPAWAEWGFHAATDRTTAPNRSTPVFIPLKVEPAFAPPPPILIDLYPPATAKSNIVKEVERYRLGRADTTVAATRLYLIELLALDRDDERWRNIRAEMFRLVRS
jgi:hypothetical protein